MASVRFIDVQSRPTEFLEFTSLPLDEFHQLVPPFEAAFQAHMAMCRLDRKPPHRSPYCRVQKLDLIGINSTFFRSIYFQDPDGITLEFACRGRPLTEADVVHEPKTAADLNYEKQVDTVRRAQAAAEAAGLVPHAMQTR